MTGTLDAQRSHRCHLSQVPNFTAIISSCFVTTYITNMWWNACVFWDVCMHVVLDLGLWRISAQETRGPCGPLMGMELSDHRGMLQGTHTHTHTASAFLSDAPHATREVINTCEHFWRTRKEKLACVSGENANAEAASLPTVYAAVTCGFPGGPGPLWGAWGPRAKLC